MKKLLTKGMHFLALALLLGILGSSQSRADEIKIQCDAHFDPAGIFHVFWAVEGDLDEIESYKIFLAPGFIKDIDANRDEFEEIFSATAEELSEDHGMMGFYQVEVEYPYEIAFLEATLFVEAYTDNGDSYMSEPLFMDFDYTDPRERLQFTTYLEKYTYFKGEIFEYDCDAEYPLDKEKEVNYELIDAPEGMKINELTGLVEWAPIDGGYYQFGIRAFLSENEKIEAYQYFNVKISNCEEPVTLSGTIKDEDGKLVTSGGVYLMGEFMIFDDEGGQDFEEKYYQQITDGTFEFKVDAGEYTLMYGNEYLGQYWYNEDGKYNEPTIIEVECDVNKTIDMTVPKIDFELYTVSGTVLDEEGNAVLEAYVSFIPTDDNNFYRQYSVHPDENGNYSIQLPDMHSYKAFVIAFMENELFGFEMPLYYNQTYNPSKAEIITLTADRDDINFVVGATDDFEYYKLGGYVTDENDNPMPGVYVEVMGTNDDPDFYCNKLHFSAMTDQDGYYEVEVPDIFSYIVSANNYLDFYGSLYYNQTYNYEEAELITLTGDRDDINFKFKNFDNVASGKIQGNVVDENGDNLLVAHVEAILIEPTDSDIGHWGMTRNIYSENGEFSISNLIPGKYVLFAFGFDEAQIYEPGFYVKAGPVTLDLDDATKLTVEENGIISGITIQMKVMKGIAEDAGKSNGKLSGAVINAQSEENIAGAKIFLQNSNGDLIEFESTSSTGVFNISLPDNGEYKLMASKVGFKDYERALNINEAGNHNIGTIPLVPNSVTSVETLEKSGAYAYPNPSGNEFNLVFKASGATATARLLDLRGNVVDTFTINTQVGLNTYNYQNEELVNGTYFIEIKEDKAIAVIPIVIAR